MMQEWRYIHASVSGTSHIEKNIPCQDFHLCTNFIANNGENILIITASDGAGSALRSGEGSKIACEIFTEKAKVYLAEGNPVSSITKAIIADWIDEIRQQFTYMQAPENASIKDFACTFMTAVIGEKGAAFLQVGDGGIVVGNDDEHDTYCWIFWPEKGDYANVTYFLTDADVYDHIQFDNINRDFSEVAIFTDGLERLALNYSLQEVFNPFFKGFFGTLNSGQDKNELNAALAGFLDSPRVNERTDDDKTLILASRQLHHIPAQ